MRTRRTRMPRGPYIEHTTPVRVRFQEVDALRIVWHGHFVSYMEDAREDLGRAYGIGYQDFLRAGIVPPLVHVECSYLAPLEYGDHVEVTTRLYPQQRAVLEMYYQLRRARDGKLVAVGRSVQVFTDTAGNMQLTIPDFITDFYTRWADRMREDDE